MGWTWQHASNSGCRTLNCVPALYSDIIMIDQRHFTVNFAERCGSFRQLHGANNGPRNWGGLTDLSPFHRELAFPYIRLHDSHWPNPDVVDIDAVFPNFDADPSAADSYTFDRTDNYLQAIIDNGSKIIYRLGHGIEHTVRKYHTKPPLNYAHWAEIAVGIIRRYNDGWANR
jgi:xylan 1,4-beta-xylosidase